MFAFEFAAVVWFAFDVSNTASNGKFTPYIAGISNVNNRSNALNQCKNKGRYCTQLLYLDNWEYKSDYPYKL